MSAIQGRLSGSQYASLLKNIDPNEPKHPYVFKHKNSRYEVLSTPKNKPAKGFEPLTLRELALLAIACVQELNQNPEDSTLVQPKLKAMVDKKEVHEMNRNVLVRGFLHLVQRIYNVTHSLGWNTDLQIVRGACQLIRVVIIPKPKREPSPPPMQRDEGLPETRRREDLPVVSVAPSVSNEENQPVIQTDSPTSVVIHEGSHQKKEEEHKLEEEAQKPLSGSTLAPQVEEKHTQPEVAEESTTTVILSLAVVEEHESSSHIKDEKSSGESDVIVRVPTPLIEEKHTQPEVVVEPAATESPAAVEEHESRSQIKDEKSPDAEAEVILSVPIPPREEILQASTSSLLSKRSSTPPPGPIVKTDFDRPLQIKANKGSPTPWEPLNQPLSPLPRDEADTLPNLKPPILTPPLLAMNKPPQPTPKVLPKERPTTPPPQVTPKEQPTQRLYRSKSVHNPSTGLTIAGINPYSSHIKERRDAPPEQVKLPDGATPSAGSRKKIMEMFETRKTQSAAPDEQVDIIAKANLSNPEELKKVVTLYRGKDVRGLAIKAILDRFNTPGQKLTPQFVQACFADGLPENNYSLFKMLELYLQQGVDRARDSSGKVVLPKTSPIILDAVKGLLQDEAYKELMQYKSLGILEEVLADSSFNLGILKELLLIYLVNEGKRRGDIGKSEPAVVSLLFDKFKTSRDMIEGLRNGKDITSKDLYFYILMWNLEAVIFNKEGKQSGCFLEEPFKEWNEIKTTSAKFSHPLCIHLLDYLRKQNMSEQAALKCLSCDDMEIFKVRCSYYLLKNFLEDYVGENRVERTENNPHISLDHPRVYGTLLNLINNPEHIGEGAGVKIETLLRLMLDTSQGNTGIISGLLSTFAYRVVHKVSLNEVQQGFITFLVNYVRTTPALMKWAFALRGEEPECSIKDFLIEKGVLPKRTIEAQTTFSTTHRGSLKGVSFKGGS